MNHILINATHKEEIRVAIIKNKKLIDFNIESSLNKKTKGSVYLGKISRIEPSLEAAFVDYGKERQGFLPFKEVAISFYNNTQDSNSKPNITDVLKEGQKIIVQVVKEERGNKGAALSTYVNLAGAYIILMSNNPKNHGISRKTDTADKQSIREIINKITLPNNTGLIVRTAGAGKRLEELQWEVNYLSNLWKAINIVAKKNSAPFLIYQESDIIICTLRDYLRESIDSVMIDDPIDFQNAKDFVSFVFPHYLERIQFFDSSGHSLFDYMGIETQINNVFSREVSLPSGATIIFDSTEALTAIDINSARATKGSDIKETSYKTNLEAVKEIALQLQLRDIGGLVVIDFIDMTSKEYKTSIEKAMEKATASDRSRINIDTISKFGLLEMSRQRLMNSVTELVGRTCSVCNGRGTTPTIPTLALTIIRMVEDNCNKFKQTIRLTVQSSVEVITYILNEKRMNVTKLEEKHNVKITLLPNPYMQFPNFTINKQNSERKSQHKSYQGLSKPLHTLADNGLENNPETPAINVNKPRTRIPEKKLKLLKKIKIILFDKEKPQIKRAKSNFNNKNCNHNKNKQNKKFR